MSRPRRLPQSGDVLTARTMRWIIQRVMAFVRGGPGIRIATGPGGEITIVNTRKGGSPAALCPKWSFRATSDSVPELQIFNPGTIGGEMPKVGTDLLSLTPPPLIEIPVGSAAYIVFLKFEWEPDSVEVAASDWVVGQGGTLVEDILVVVTAEASPPSNQEPTVNTTTGAVINNGIYHRRIGRVVRDGASGPLKDIVSDHCYSLDYSICNPRVVLGSAS